MLIFVRICGHGHSAGWALLSIGLCLLRARDISEMHLLPLCGSRGGLESSSEHPMVQGWIWLLLPGSCLLSFTGPQTSQEPLASLYLPPGKVLTRSSTFHTGQLTMSGCRVFIGHLSPHARERDVEKFFKGYGRIREINLKNGFGFVVSLSDCW